MRKKSHISLAKYLLESMGTQELRNHKKSFYIGSIWPDCTPSFITRRHCIEDTFHILKDEIANITEHYDTSQGMNRYFCRHLGIITHYVADYFTFPHNSTFTGTIKEHCEYESELKHVFKQYVNSDDAMKIREINGTFRSVDQICIFIKRMHDEYLNAIKEVKEDCLYIVMLCHKVVDAILQIFELQTAPQAAAAHA